MDLKLCSDVLVPTVNIVDTLTFVTVFTSRYLNIKSFEMLLSLGYSMKCGLKILYLMIAISTTLKSWDAQQKPVLVIGQPI